MLLYAGFAVEKDEFCDKKKPIDSLHFVPNVTYRIWYKELSSKKSIIHNSHIKINLHTILLRIKEEFGRKRHSKSEFSVRYCWIIQSSFYRSLNIIWRDVIAFSLASFWFISRSYNGMPSCSRTEISLHPQGILWRIGTLRAFAVKLIIFIFPFSSENCLADCNKFKNYSVSCFA